MEYMQSVFNDSLELNFNGTLLNSTNELSETVMECKVSDEDYDPALKSFYYSYGAAHGYVSTLVSIFGILANVANIVVLTRKNMKSSVNLILTWLAVADLLTMIVYLPMAVHFYILRDPSLIPQTTYSYHWNIFLLLFSHFSIIFHTCAIWFTIDLAVFRVLYILLPTRGPTMCTLKRAQLAVVLTCLSVSIMGIPNYLSNGPVEILCNNKSVYTVDASELLRANEYLFQINFWTQAIFFKLLPCALLTILTILLVHAMHQANIRRMRLKSQGRREESNRHQETNRTTGMLLAVVVLFLITELPQGIFTILSGTIPGFFIRIYTPLGDLMDILALLNNSVNFVLYCVMSRQFRTTFTSIFCKWLPQPPNCCRLQSGGYCPQKSNGVSVDSATQSTEMTKVLLQNNNGQNVA